MEYSKVHEGLNLQTGGKKSFKSREWSCIEIIVCSNSIFGQWLYNQRVTY